MTPFTLRACAMFLIAGCSPQAGESRGTVGHDMRIQHAVRAPCRGETWTSTHDGHKLRGWGYVSNSRTPVPPETTHGYCNRDIGLACDTKAYRCEVREQPDGAESGASGEADGSNGTREAL